jgi:two-component system nitrogen regulation sensor histidine kinase NtrY
MQRSLLIVSFILVSLIAGLLVIQHISGSSNQVTEIIEQNLTDVLDDQREDFGEFLDQFSIYSNPFDIASDKRFRKRVFVNESLVYWSDNMLIEDYQQLRALPSLSVLSVASGVYITRKTIIGSKESEIEIYSFYPLVADSQISNQFLSKRYSQEVFQNYHVKVGDGEQRIVYQDLEVKVNIPDQPIYRFDEWVVFLGFLLCMAVGALVSFWRLGRFSGYTRMGLIFLIVLSLRVFMWIITHELTQVHLFNPLHYTSSYASSLGDLLLHSLVVVALVLMVVKELGQIGRSSRKWIIEILLLAVLHFAAFALYKVCSNILNNSLISLDISESLVFDSLRVVAFIILILWAGLFVRLFGFVSQFFSNKDSLWRLLSVYLLTALISVWIAGGFSAYYFGFLGLVFWGVILFRVGFDRVNFGFSSFIHVSILVAFVAVIYSMAIYKYFEKEELVSKAKFANRLLIRNDFLGEYYLSENLRQISQDTYIRSRLGNRLLDHRNIVEKINGQYLSSYFDKYDVEIALFDDEGQNIEGQDANYSELKSRIKEEAIQTDYVNIYFQQGNEENVQDKYYCLIPIVSFDQQVGFVVLTLTLKKYIPSSVFPQLLVESQYAFTDENRFDYALYNEGKLIYKRGRLGFQGLLDYPDLINPQLFEEGLEIGGTHFYGQRTSDGRTFVIASPAYKSIAFLSNFSFLFLTILFGIGLVMAGVSLSEHRMSVNLSTQIQLYLGLSFVIPLLIVSLALLNTLNKSYQEEIDQSFNSKAYSVSEYLIGVTEAFYFNQINRVELQSEVSRVASLLQSDINLYSAEGKLLVSSEQEIFNSGLLGFQIDPAPFNAIKYNDEESGVYKQSIGDLDFSIAYVGLRSYKDGHLLGILSLPYFDSKNRLIRQQIEVFNNLVSIFTIIFLVSVIFGNWAVQGLVRPLKVITERLKQTDLKEVNNPIEYHSTDEIGLLIREYNEMIGKLEASKRALAESQKESAWKEIARQVAHEIKNPLTPMRLKIQQLMREQGTESKSYKALSSLIGQIDALSTIADSFSAFARMPAPKNEVFDLSQLVLEVVEVHEREDLTIETTIPEKHVFVNTDPKIFSGIMNNMILNAVQATHNSSPEIAVRIELKSRKVILSVSDRGEGIDEENKEKIFTPYFSTKTTGSGIGLAVAKKGIENAGGNIWFESKVGEGTTFFIALPVVD